MTQSQPGEEDLFNAARRIDDSAARAAFLREAAAGDEALLRRVEALLAAHEATDRLLDVPVVAGPTTRPSRPAADSTGPAPSVEAVGSHVGPYKLLEQIGEGGMGAVYMAEQPHPIRRRVALKVIRPGMDSHQVVARFEAERQALALMDHANIARVFDGGTTSTGLPYFVMELVNGVSITKYCDDNRLTPRERLELFVPVCQAIQHAHQKGVIHRDIKPSNVMVTLHDGRPVPKVIDFGVAKATEQRLTDRTLFTHFGTVVGTLEYMSPEQAEVSPLGVDTRSDVYSLGVLLYELLTGSTPLDQKRMKQAAFAEIVRRIKEEEPPRPSCRLSDSGEALGSIAAVRRTEPAKLSKLVRGDLDSVVMKSLEKDRERRYESALGLASDVQRYLDHEPIQARPISARQRAWRWYRRNDAIVAGAFTVFTFVTPVFMYIALFCITQLTAGSRDRSEVLSGLGFTAGVVVAYSACAESGVAACLGKRRGLWASSFAFVWFTSMSVWTLYCAVEVSREFSDIPIYSIRSFDVHTADGRSGFIRNSVIGFALMGMSWSVLGLALQIHALRTRAAGTWGNPHREATSRRPLRSGSNSPTQP